MLAFLALPAAAGLALTPAWSQSADPDDNDPFPEPLTDVRTPGADEATGLRGRLDPLVADPILLRRQEEERSTDRFLRGTTVPEDASRRRPAGPLSGEDRDDGSVETTADDQAASREAARDAQEEEVDPYAPIGVRFGSFLLFPELGVERVYEDNVFLSSTNPRGDWRYELSPSLEIQSDWSRHSLVGTVSAIRSYHDEFDGENDKDFAAALTGRLDVRSTTNLVGSVSYTEEPEDRSSNDFPLDAADRALTRTKAASLEANHTFNRVTVTLRGELESEDFDDATAEDGSLINNDDRDFTERRVTARIAYELQPGVAAFVEGSTNDRDFVEAIDDNGLLNGSSGYDVQAGLSFLLSGKLTGEASVGYAVQTPEEPSQIDVDGLIFNAGLEWQATALTAFRLDASSEVDETTDAGSAGSIIRTVAVSVEHRLRRNIVLGASVEYENEKFAGTDERDEEWLYAVAAEYFLNPSAALTFAYEHARDIGSAPDDGYTANEVRFGVRVRR